MASPFIEVKHALQKDCKPSEIGYTISNASVYRIKYCKDISRNMNQILGEKLKYKKPFQAATHDVIRTNTSYAKKNPPPPDGR